MSRQFLSYVEEEKSCLGAVGERFGEVMIRNRQLETCVITVANPDCFVSSFLVINDLFTERQIQPVVMLQAGVSCVNFSRTRG